MLCHFYWHKTNTNSGSRLTLYVNCKLSTKFRALSLALTFKLNFSQKGKISQRYDCHFHVEQIKLHLKEIFHTNIDSLVALKIWTFIKTFFYQTRRINTLCCLSKYPFMPKYLWYYIFNAKTDTKKNFWNCYFFY